MGVKTFSTIVQAKMLIEPLIEIAIKNVAQRMTEELESYIREDFYNAYRPKFYDRTYQLLKSPKFKMDNFNSATVFIDTDAMHYLSGEYGFTGQDSAYYASLGWHGSPDIMTEGHYWEDFMTWCNNNVVLLMRQELRKQGLNVK
jgi:hypothetical protein